MDSVIKALKEERYVSYSSSNATGELIIVRQTDELVAFLSRNEAIEVLVDRPEKIEHFTADLPDAAWDLLDLEQENLQLSFQPKRALPSSLLELPSISFRVIYDKQGMQLLRRFNGCLLSGRTKNTRPDAVSLQLIPQKKMDHISFDEKGRISI